MFRKIALLLMALAPLALADYHYASHNGTNTYPYTSWETAADSIGAAMQAAEPYDTIYIAAGEYYEVVDGNREDSCLAFIGAGLDSTHCWTDSTVNLWAVGNGTFVKNIWFQHNTSRACIGPVGLTVSIVAIDCRFSWGVGIVPTGDSIIVENCEFYNCNNALSLYMFAGKLIYRNNIFINSTGRSTMVFGGGWYYAIIENNIFNFLSAAYLARFSERSAWEDSCIFRNNYIDNFYDGHGIAGPIKAEISNNTVRRAYCDPTIGNGAFRVLYDQGRVGYVDFTNNAITESKYGISISPYYDTMSIRYNGFWGNVYDNVRVNDWNRIDTLGNVYSYPLFANPDSFDVHLQFNSPLIDAGDPEIFDRDGSRSDIGVYGGSGGSSYEYQNLPPQPPYGLSVFIYPFPFGDSIYINWHVNYEPDFLHYEVYWDTFSGFIPSMFNLVATPETSYFADGGLIPTQDYFYRIRSLDNLNQPSAYSDELPVYLSGIEDDSGVEMPSFASIEQNYPNPFNSSTTIIYTVANLGPLPAQINIDIYDLQGRKVKSLINEREEAGKHKVIWDARDDSGNELATGIYFARITQWNVDYLSKTQKLVHLK
jgi:hypothetical protein